MDLCHVLPTCARGRPPQRRGAHPPGPSPGRGSPAPPASPASPGGTASVGPQGQADPTHLAGVVMEGEGRRRTLNFKFDKIERIEFWWRVIQFTGWLISHRGGGVSPSYDTCYYLPIIIHIYIIIHILSYTYTNSFLPGPDFKRPNNAPRALFGVWEVKCGVGAW